MLDCNGQGVGVPSLVVAVTRSVMVKKVGFSNWGTAGTITGEEMICGDQHCQMNDDDVEGIE